jgi:hypothetical protein
LIKKCCNNLPNKSIFWPGQSEGSSAWLQNRLDEARGAGWRARNRLAGQLYGLTGRSGGSLDLVSH